MELKRIILNTTGQIINKHNTMGQITNKCNLSDINVAPFRIYIASVPQCSYVQNRLMLKCDNSGFRQIQISI